MHITADDSETKCPSFVVVHEVGENICVCVCVCLCFVMSY